MSRGCPDADTLVAFLEGRLFGPESDELESHLDHCTACLSVARTVPAGDWLGSAEGPTPNWIPAEELPVVDELLRRAASVYAEETSPRASPADLVAELRRRFGRPDRPDELGRIGPYRLLSVLGLGGMGVVLRAADERLRRPVALKLLRPDTAGRSHAHARFLREARAMAAVVHEHVVPVYEVGEAEGLPYLVMPLLPGESLASWIATNAPAEPTLAVRWARQGAEGLAAAHAAGLIHRDVKPSNLWLEHAPDAPTRVRLLDFGLVRDPQQNESATLPGVLLGTPEYLAPEQARGEATDARADLFALGCVLYEMLTGISPFRRPTLLATLSALAGEAPGDVRQCNPAVPAALARLVGELLARRPEGRPASARVVAQRLADIETGAAQRSTRTIRFAALVTAAALAVIVTGVGVGLLNRPETPALTRSAEPQQTKRPDRLIGHTAAVTTLLFLPGGDEVMSGSTDRTVRRWSLATGKELGEALTLSDRCVGLALAPDGSTLAMVSADGAIRVSATASGKVLAELTEPQRVSAVTFGGNADTLFVGTERGVTRWSIRTRVRKADFDWGTFSICWLGMQPKGEWLVGGSPRGETLMFRSLTQSISRQHVWAHKAPVRGGAFSPDGARLATVAGPPDGKVQLWDVASGKPLEGPADRPSHAGGAAAVAWSSGGLIASTGLDGVVRLWEPDTGQPRGHLQTRRPGPDGLAITCMTFSPDGRRLAAGGSDGSVGVWNVSEIENPPPR